MRENCETVVGVGRGDHRGHVFDLVVRDCFPDLPVVVRMFPQHRDGGVWNRANRQIPRRIVPSLHFGDGHAEHEEVLVLREALSAGRQFDLGIQEVRGAGPVGRIDRDIGALQDVCP